VAIGNAAFTPTDHEVARAERIVTAFDEARRIGKDRAHVDGHHVELPTWRNAQVLLERAAALKGRGPTSRTS
jgi:citrate lyase beta subunit